MQQAQATAANQAQQQAAAAAAAQAQAVAAAAGAGVQQVLRPRLFLNGRIRRGNPPILEWFRSDRRLPSKRRLMQSICVWLLRF